MSQTDALPRRPSWPRALLRPAALTAVVLVSWPISGVVVALDEWYWFVLGLPVFLGMLLCAYLAKESDDKRMWPYPAAFLVLALSVWPGVSAPGNWYLRVEGVPMDAIVADVTCYRAEPDDDCEFIHTLYADDVQLTADFRESDRYEVGRMLEVVADPRDWVPVRLAEDVDDSLPDYAAVVGLAGYIAIAVTIAVTAEVRRRRLQAASVAGAAAGASDGRY